MLNDSVLATTNPRYDVSSSHHHHHHRLDRNRMHRMRHCRLLIFFCSGAIITLSIMLGAANSLCFFLSGGGVFFILLLPGTRQLSTPSLANASEDEMLKAAIAASLREAESVHASKKPKSVTAISSDEEDWGEEDDYESDNGDDFVAIDEESDDDSAWSKPEESKSNNIITARPEPAADISDAVTVCLVFPDGSRLQRRFYSDESVQVLKHVIEEKGNIQVPFHAMRSNPRVDILAAAPHETFGDLSIKRELIRVETD
eukprot:m.194079 g.194079  ORF g.194079 m.194079 type:complete len:258 (+) comp16787_c6_seq7:912-1685(+)